MILFVDLEHESARSEPWGQFILAARTRITYDLQEITGDVCLLQHYTAVDADVIERLGIRAIFLSGFSTDPDPHADPLLDRVRGLVVAGDVPIFGFCGGFQLMMEAHGSEITRIGPLQPGDPDPDPGYMPGWRTETGYLPVEITGSHPLLAGLGSRPVFRQYHGWEVGELPAGFVNLATTPLSRNQLVVNDSTLQVGTQFHPEYFTDEHNAGRRLIENFSRWAMEGS